MKVSKGQTAGGKRQNSEATKKSKDHDELTPANHGRYETATVSKVTMISRIDLCDVKLEPT